MFETMTLFTLQQYWWLLVSVLGAALVFLLFVQGGQSLLYSIGKSEMERTMLVNSLGRKWEFTFTTLVTFGGAFFASFPLFYSTSFGGAYWLWMLVLSTFIIQAVSYEYRNKQSNVLGKKTFEWFLFLNGLIGTVSLGVAVATMFTGGNFIHNEMNFTSWANSYHGLEAFANPVNLALGVAVFFLAFMFAIWLGDGYAYNSITGEIFTEPNKYFFNMIEAPVVGILFLLGVLMVLLGLYRGIFCFTKCNDRAIWPVGIGVFLTVLSLFFNLGYNNTVFYPSLADMQSGLTIRTASSSHFTLTAMSYVSLLVPFVAAYMIYAWRAINNKKIDKDEMESDTHVY
ncbi:MAG: cytochrome C oxidase assembly protein [Bacteroidetes bacterium HGW-Bacteroidetes-6]|nr:MAG: cytochrome C oxidase assembly protein [Bacteroidetes bacterium HGW-Bacteroidetes-6]